MDTNRLYYGYDRAAVNEHALAEFSVTRKKKLYYKNIIYFETKTCFIFHSSTNQDIIDIISQLVSTYHCSNSETLRHVIILLNIEDMGEDNSKALRVILEKFHRTTLFVATTSSVSAVEEAIRSRFYLIRVATRFSMKRVLYKKEWNNIRSVRDLRLISSRIQVYPLPDIIKSIMSLIQCEGKAWRFLERAIEIEGRYLSLMRFFGVGLVDKRYFIDLLVLEGKMI